MDFLIRHKKQLKSLLLLTILIWHISSVSLFLHSHNINGRIITHSHPYSQTSENLEHSHSSAQIHTISQLSVLLMLSAIFFAFAILSCKAYTQNTDRKLFPNTGAFLHCTLRGPPPIC